MRYGLARILAPMVALCFLSLVPASAQEFPYQAPRAPEFDSSGNYRSSGAPQKKRIRTANRQTQPAPRSSRGRSAPKPRPISPKPPGATYASHNSGPGPQPRAVTASNRPAQRRAPSAAARPSCSEYPARLANAKSQAEMQQIARYYMGCLMKNGWSQQQAKNQVITTIEGVFKR